MTFSRSALSLLLGLAVSVGWVHAQTLVRLAASHEPDGTDHTGEITSFTDIGSGEPDTTPRPWVCYTSNTSNVEWLLPDGNAVLAQGAVAVEGDPLIIRVINKFGVALSRGPSHFSPDGEHCCVRTGTSERRCVTFTPCPTLTPLTDTNGTISYDPVTNMATYGCVSGHVPNITSGDQQRTCQGTSGDTSAGTWTGTPATVICTFVDCGPLSNPTNGAVDTSSGTTFGNTATYTCNPGYTPNEMVARTCQANGIWNGSEPVCNLACPTLDDVPDNGMVTYSNTTVPIQDGTTATYSCDTGYDLSEAVTRTCRAIGSPIGWTGGDSPTCTIVECVSLSDPTNGGVMITGTVYQSTATYTCDLGYTLTGTMTRMCQDTAMWSGSAPTCEALCPRESPSNGMVTYSPDDDPPQPGAVATYTCDTGYDLSGAMTRNCVAVSGWSATLPACNLVDCGPLTNPTNGKLETPSGTTFGNTATYTCNPGYVRSHPDRTCQANGEWSGSVPVCNLICPNLDVPDNGVVTYSDPTVPRSDGSTATYSCVTGYEASGTVTRTCVYTSSPSGWTGGDSPTCTIVDCGSLRDPTNGGVMITGTIYQSTANYTCNPGYTLGGTMTRTCQGTAMWSGAAPTCDALCPRESPSNGMVIYSPDDDPPQPGAVATYTCDTGHELSGAMTRNCVAVSGWSATLPACNPVDCNGLTNPPNGTVNTSSGTTFMMTATYTCNLGYNIDGSTTRTCRADRMWTPEAPTCPPVDCGPLTVPNGRVSTSGTTFMNSATYSCDSGYNLNGAATRTCQASGDWSLTAPACDPVDCGSLNATANGAVDTSSGTTFMMTATYTCNPGYALSSTDGRMCLASAVWSGAAPVCNLIPLSSGSMAVANNSALSLAAIGEGSSALTCHTELTTCCRGEDNNGSNALGQWTGPDGNIPDSSDDGFYVSRDMSSISLNLAEGSSVVAGTYCCQVPRDSGMTTHCIVVTITASVSPTAAVAGGVVGGIVVVLLVILVIVIVVLVLRRSRKKQYKPAAKDAVFSTVYTKHSDASDGAATISKHQEPTISGFPSESRANEGEEVVIRAKVGGHPPPSLTWYHNGEKVTADYATELGKDGGLSFPSVETKHAGVYKLVASGPSGTAEKELQLIVVAEGDAEEEPADVDLTPIPVNEFGAYVTEQHANGNKKFASNYLGLSGKESKEHSTTIAKQNKDLNRFGNILVYDDNQIILEPVPGQDECQGGYINACYVDGFDKPKKFIASQGPLPNTLVDFWRMIWQERPPIIVMLTNLKENNKIKCEQYWPDSGSVSYGPYTVAITDQQVLADYTVRSLLLTMQGDSGKPFKTTQFHFTTWPDHGVPDYATPILGFHRRVKSQHKPSKGPLLVHCSAGVGRTGTYIAIDNVLDQISAEGLVDISGTIVRARNQRMKLVQTQDQYVFIHDAILESVTCGDTQVSAGDLRRQIQKMSSVAPGKTISKFQYQFQILEQVSPNPNEVNCSTALRHKDLNRGTQYLPIDNHRVFLKGQDPGRDYINAVFVNGYKHKKAYIIAQNPLDSTVRNFWKVIYDRKCAAVVMLTPLSENGQEACSKYWPDSGSVTSFGEFTIDNLGEETNPGFTMRQLSVLNGKTKQTLQVTQFQILNWKSTGACHNFQTVTNVNEEVIKIQRRTGNKAIVVHCSDTATRSGMYCSIATTIDRCKTEGVVDVFQVVKALRVHKPGAVPSVDNYRGVFEALLIYSDSFDTYANFL